MNKAELAKLPGEATTYTARDTTQNGGDKMGSVFDDVGLVKDLQLKVGAVVVLCKNVGDVRETGLFNGRPGRVVRLGRDSVDVDFPPLPGDTRDDVRRVGIGRQSADVYVGKRIVATRKQIPLALAWAQTLHRAQGQTVHADGVVGRVDNNLFEPGMAYVFWSRLKRLDQLVLEEFRPEFVRAHPDAIAFYNGLAAVGGAGHGHVQDNV